MFMMSLPEFAAEYSLTFIVRIQLKCNTENLPYFAVFIKCFFLKILPFSLI